MIDDPRYAGYLLRGALEAAHIICTNDDASDCDHSVYDFFMTKLQYYDTKSYTEIAEMVNYIYTLKGTKH
ncbi:hypothetical protein [Pantoea sp. ME81]|uniref:hypothetical protein n=1 Tax=Pantoea sp. ME81 TaxID=2743935 RepID=UPI0015F35612|nr:hypothetical protein [Pantoea sp. ME81]